MHIFSSECLLQLWNLGYTWFIEIWNSGYAWLVERWDDVAYWQTIWQSPSLPEWLTSFPGVFFLEGVEPCLWYAAIVALDLKVIWFLAEGSSSYPRVLGTGPAAEALRCDLELKRGAPTPQQ